MDFYSFFKENPFYNQLVSFYETNSGLQETKELKEASCKISELVIDIVRKGKKQKSIRENLNETEFSFWLCGTTIEIIQLMEVKGKILTETLKQTEVEFYSSHVALIINCLK